MRSRKIGVLRRSVVKIEWGRVGRGGGGGGTLGVCGRFGRTRHGGTVGREGGAVEEERRVCDGIWSLEGAKGSAPRLQSALGECSAVGERAFASVRALCVIHTRHAQRHGAEGAAGHGASQLYQVASEHCRVVRPTDAKGGQQLPRQRCVLRAAAQASTRVTELRATPPKGRRSRLSPVRRAQTRPFERCKLLSAVAPPPS